MTEKEIANKLSKKFPSPQYAFLTQVRNQTGFGGEEKIRTADAMALGLWKSRGHYLQGFEIKTSRADWLNEFRNPAKASFVKYCDYWWLVIDDAKMVEDGELPVNWGMMAFENGKLKVIKDAPKNEIVEPMSREFLCGFMRKVTESIESVYTPTVEVEEAIKKGVKDGLESAINRANSDAAEYRKLMERITAFEKEAGIDLWTLKHRWSTEGAQELGRAVKLVQNGAHVRVARNLKHTRESLNRLSKDIKDEMKSIPEEWMSDL